MKFNVRIITGAGLVATKQVEVDRDATFDVRVLAPDIGEPSIKVDVTPLDTQIQAPPRIDWSDLALCSLGAWNAGTATWWPVRTAYAVAVLFMLARGTVRWRRIPWRLMTIVAFVVGFSLWAYDLVGCLVAEPSTPIPALLVMR